MKNEMKLNNKGFSLVELIVVIAIMAILVGVLAPSVLGQLDKAKQSKDKQAVDSIATAVSIAWADQDITDTKVTSFSFPTASTAADQTSSAVTTVNSTQYFSVIYNTVGYQKVFLESNAFKSSTINVTVNETTGKVTVKLTGGAQTYEVSK